MKDETFRNALITLMVAGILLMITTSFREGIADPDTWWHLAAGKYIVTNHAIPHQDVFSWSATGQPWITHEWLPEVLFYLAYLAGRFWGLLALILILATLLLVFYWKLLCPSRDSYPVAVLSLIAVGGLFYPFMQIRPQIMSYLFLVVFLYVLDIFSRRKDYLWVLPIISVLWANAHASFFIGPALICLYVITATLRITTNKISLRATLKNGHTYPQASQKHNFLSTEKTIPPVMDRSQTGKLVLTMCLCIAATLFNPNGAGLLLYPFASVGDPQMMDTIKEWLSPNFHNFNQQLFLAYYLTTFLMLVFTPHKIRPTDLILFLIFGIATFIHVRFSPYAILVSGLLWPRYLDLDLRMEFRTGLARTRAALIPILIVLYIIVLIAKAPPQSAIGYQFAPEFAKFPVRALAYLRTNPPEGRMFNDYGWGGYLIWNRPQDKVFIDGRADVYANKVLGDYITINKLKPGAAALLDSYRIGYVLMPANSALSQALRLSPRWSLVYEDQTAAILVKRE